MAAVVAGSGLGLFNSSLSQLNGYGSSGNARVGVGTDRAYVNASTGNLVIQSQDDYLAALGLDVSMVRTYNSLGLVDGDNNDNWQTSFYRKLLNLPAAGGTTAITRINGDGNQSVFTYNSSKGYWLCASGSGANDTLKQSGTQWIYEDTTSGYTETYDSNGTLLSSSDRDGHLLTYGYTGSLVTSVVTTQADGTTHETLYLDYSGNNLTQVRMAASDGSTIRVRYGYDSQNRLTQVKVDLGNIKDAVADDVDSDPNTKTYVTNYEYSGASDRITRITQGDGSELKIGYVLVGSTYRVASLQQLIGTNGGASVYRSTLFNYDTLNRRTDVYDAVGNVTQYYYDTNQRLTRVVMPAAERGELSITDYAYNSNGDINQVTNTLGDGTSRTTNYTYVNGNLTQIQDSLGNTVNRTYDAADQLLTETVYTTPDPDGTGPALPSGALTTRYIYDVEEHLRFVVSPEGRVKENQYNSAGQVVSSMVYTGQLYTSTTFTESALASWASGISDKTQGQRVDYSYDARGLLNASTRYKALTGTGAGDTSNNGAAKTSYIYEAAGQLRQVIDPRDPNYTTSYTYDGMGRVLTVTDATQRQSIASYDDAGNRIVLTSDQVGGAYRLQTTSVYSKAGDLLSQSRADQQGVSYGTTSYAYDANGRLRMVTDPAGSKTFYIYDNRGWKVGEVSPQGSLTETVYNAAGQVIRIIHYAGVVDTSTLVDGTGSPYDVTVAQLRGMAADIAGRPQVDLDSGADGTGYNVAYTENDPAKPIVNPLGLALSDSNSQNLVGATVTITNLQDIGMETLSVTTANGIAVSTAYSGSIGTLTLSGVATVAQYQQVLSTLKYQNTSENPSPVDRNIEITVTDGNTASIAAVATVSVTPVPDPPVFVNNSTSQPNFVENGSPIPVWDVAPSISDVDSTRLAGVTAQITNLINPGAEILALNPSGLSKATTYGIGVAYNNATGTLSLSGLSDIAKYADVLQALTYQNTSDNPGSTPRNISVILTDDSGTSSNPVVSTVAITPVNDAPTLDLNGADAGTDFITVFPSSGSSWNVGAPASLTDVDSANLKSVTITLVGVSALTENLSIDVTGTSLKKSYSGGVMTLTGPDPYGYAPVSEYQKALQTLMYNRTSLGGSMLTDRTIQITATDDDPSNSLTSAVGTITVLKKGSTVATDIAPVADANGAGSGVDYTTVFPSAGSSLNVGSLMAVSDSDNFMLSSARVELLNNSSLYENITIDTTGTSITASSSNGVITLTGFATLTDYQTVLRTLSYNRTSLGGTMLSDRSIQITVTDSQTKTSAIATITVLKKGSVLPASQAAANTSQTDTSTTNAAAGTSAVGTTQTSTSSPGIAAAASVTAPTIVSSATLSDAGNRNTYFVYDGAGRLVFAVADDTEGIAAGVVTKRSVVETVYDGASRVIKTVAYANRLATSVGLSESAIRAALVSDTTNDRPTRMLYSNDGLVVGQLSGDGYLTENIYDAGGRQTKTIRYATQTNSSYWASGTLAQLRPATNAIYDQTTYRYYDAEGRLSGTLDAQGYVTTYDYDAVNNKTGEARYSGATTYNASLTSVVSAATAATPSGQPTSRTQSWSYDALNRVTSQTNAEGTVTQYNYDPVSGFLTSVVVAYGDATDARTTSNQYDALGRLTQTMKGEGSAALAAAGTNATAQNQAWSAYATKYQYDLSGRLVKTTDPNGNATIYYYNRDGNLRYTVRAGQTVSGTTYGEVTEYVYNAFGEVANTIQYANRLAMTGLTGGVIAAALPGLVADTAKDRKTTATYTLRGLLLKATDAMGSVVDSEYNAFGELKQRQSDVILSAGAAKSRRTDVWTYDRTGDVQGYVRDYGGLNIGEAYLSDAFGRQFLRLDARSNLWQTTYDRLGRVVQTTDPLSQTVKTEYDAFSRVTKIYDQLNNATTYAYNDTNRTITTTTPEGIVTTRTHNREGDTISVSLPNGGVTETTTYGYDKDGRLATKVVDPGTGKLNITTSNEYDKAGLLKATVDANGIRTSYSYDPANRVLSRTVDPSSYTKPDGTVVNKSGALNLTTQYSYDAFGDSVKLIDANNIVTETTYDLDGRRTAMIVDTASLKIATVYTYDTDTDVLQVQEGIQATGSSGAWVTTGAALKTTQYQYDKAGRRTQDIVDPGSGKLNLTTSYFYDNNNNLVRKVDANGNTWRYMFDADNRLTYSVDPLGNVSQIRYDADGHIVDKVQYAVAIDLKSALLPDNFTEHDLQILISQSWSDDLSDSPKDEDLSIYKDSSLNYQKQQGNGYLSFTSGPTNGADYYPRVTGPASRIYALANGSMGFHLEVGTGVASVNRFLVAGAQGTTAASSNNYTQLSAYFRGSQVYANVWDGNVQKPNVLLGTFSDNTNYVVESEIKLSGGVTTGTLWVYKKGSSRSSGFQYTYTFGTAWTTATTSAFLMRSASLSGSATMTVDNLIEYKIDAGGNPIGSDADRHTKSVYDKDGRPVSIIDGTGAVTGYKYDSAGRVTDTIRYAGSGGIDQHTHVVYDAAGRAVYQIDAMGDLVENSYDAAGNRNISRAYATRLNGTVTYTADGIASIVISQNLKSNPANRVAYYAYDAANRQRFELHVQSTSGNSDTVYITEIRYDKVGRISDSYRYAQTKTINNTSAPALSSLMTLVSNGTSSSDDQHTHSDYDGAGRLTWITDAENYTQHYTYDNLGNKLSYKNQNDDVWTYVNDAAGRLSIEISPTIAIGSVTAAGVVNFVSSNVATQFIYDGLGNITARIEGPQSATLPTQFRVTLYGYDAAGRQVATSFADQIIVNGITYGQFAANASAGLTTGVTYDALGNAVVQKNAGGVFSYKVYDLAGRVLYDIDEERRVTQHGYDAFDNQTTLTRYNNSINVSHHAGDPYTAAEVAAYFASNASSSDRTITTQYDGLNRKTKVTQSAVYVYDSLSQTSSTASPVTTFSYDAFSDLVSESQLSGTGGGSDITYSYYDRLGNKKATIDPRGYLTEWQYSATGKIVDEIQWGDVAPSWNGSTYTAPTATPSSTPNATTAASLASRQYGNYRETKYTYDRLDRQKSVTRLGVIKAAVMPDGSVDTGVGSLIITKTVYDGVGNVLAVTDASGATTSFKYDALGRQIATTGPMTNGIQLPDGTLANISSLTQYGYDAFGNQLWQTRFAFGASASDPSAARQPSAQYDSTSYNLYDILGRVTAAYDPLKQGVSYQYDAFGHVIQTERGYTNIDGSAGHLLQTFTYNGRGLLVGQSDLLPTGSTVTHTIDYNSFGEVIRKGVTGGDQAELDGNWEFYQYDNDGQLIFGNADGVDTVYLHDLRGNTTAKITSVTQDLGALITGNTPAPVANLTSGVRRAEMVYDALGHVTQQREASFTETSLASRWYLRPTVYLSPSIPIAIVVDGQTPTGATLSVRIAPVGTNSWTSLAVTLDSVSGSWMATVPNSLSVGTYKYELTATVPNQTLAVATQSGTILLNGTGMVGYNASPSGITMSKQTPATINGVPNTAQYYVFTPVAGSGISLSGMTAVDLNGKIRYSVISLGNGSYGMPVPDGTTILSFRPVGVSSSLSVFYTANVSGTATASSNALAFLTSLFEGALPLNSLVGRDLKIASFDKKAIDSGADESWTSVPLGTGYQDLLTLGLYDDFFDFRVRVTTSNGGAVDLSQVIVNGRPLGDANGYVTGSFRSEYGVQTTVDDTPTNQQSITYTPTSSRTYDRWGNVRLQTESSGLVSNASAGVTPVGTEGLGVTTAYRYDEFNRLIEVKKASVNAFANDGTSTLVTPTYETAYDAMGRVIAGIDANGNLTTESYDAAGNLITSTDATQAASSYRYDALGRKVASFDAFGYATSYAYDLKGQLVSVKTPEKANPDTYNYDALGNRVADNRSGIRLVYDAQGHVIKKIVASPSGGNTTFYVYNSLGNLRYQTDGNGNTENWTYDYFGHLLSHTDIFGSANSGDTLYTGGNVTTYSYDLSGAVTQEKLFNMYTGKYYVKLYSYYDNGLLKRVYDPREDDVASLEQPTRETMTDYIYDAGGRVTQKRASFFDLKQIRDFGATPLWSDLDNAVYQYDADGRLQNSYDRDVKSTYAYDAQGNRKLVTASYLDTQTGVSSLPLRTTIYRYNYDADNRVIDEVQLEYEVRGSNTYLYKGAATHFSFDNVGNRTGESDYARPYSNGATLAAGSTLYSELDQQENASWLSVSYINQYDKENRLRRSTAYNPNGSQKSYTTRDYEPDSDRLMTYYDSAANKTQKYQYNLDGTLARLDIIPGSGDATYNAYSYDSAGNLTGLKNKKTSDNSLLNQYVYKYVLGAGGYQQQSISVGSSTTTYEYNYRDDLARVSQSAQNGRESIYLYDTEGKIVSKVEGQKSNGSFASQTFSRSYFFGDQVLGSSSTTTSSDVTTLDFGFNDTPISDAYPAISPSQYVVNGGDTLQSIALSVYGDSSLWYIIADANALDGGGTLTAGQVLQIPNSVTNAGNTSETFQPYKASEIIGDQTPQPPQPSQHCNTLAMVLIVAVAIVVTVYTAGVAASGFTAFGAEAFGAGAAALSGTAAVGVAGSIGAAAVGGALGSIASQEVAIGLGQQNGVSLKQVAIGALGAAAGAGVGAGLDALGQSFEFLSTATQALQEGNSGALTADQLVALSERGVLEGLANGAAQNGIGVAMNAQSHFNWNAVAAAAITTGLAEPLGTRYPVLQVNDVEASIVGVARSAAINVALGTTRQYITTALQGHGRVDIQSVAADAFGNALGNSIVSKLSTTDADEQQQRQRENRLNLSVPGNEGFSLVDNGGLSLAEGSYPPGFFGSGAETPSGSIFAGGGYEVADSGEIATDARYDGSASIPNESPALSGADLEQLANQNGLSPDDNWMGHAGPNEIGLTIYGARGGSNLDSADYVQSLTGGATIGPETGFFRANPVGRFFATALGDLAAVPLSVFRSDGDVVNPINGYSLTPKEIFDAKFGLVTSVLGEATSLAATVGRRTLTAIEDTVSEIASRRAYLNEKFGRTGNLDLDINIRGRQETASNFFLAQGVPEGKVSSYLTGIDFTQPVEVQVLGSSKRLWQYQVPGAPQGSWYSFSPDVLPTQLGISPMGFNRTTQTVEPKVLNQYLSTDSVTVLRSTSAAVNDTWSVGGQAYPTIGGARQLFSTQYSAFTLVPQ